MVQERGAAGATGWQEGKCWSESRGQVASSPPWGPGEAWDPPVGAEAPGALQVEGSRTQLSVCSLQITLISMIPVVHIPSS